MLSKVVGLSTAQIMTYHMKFIDGKICNGYTFVLFSYRADKFLDGLLFGVTAATWIDRSYSRGMHLIWSKRSNGILSGLLIEQYMRYLETCVGREDLINWAVCSFHDRESGTELAYFPLFTILSQEHDKNILDFRTQANYNN